MPAVSFLIIVLVSAFSSQAIAYVGPGAGVTMIGALWGVIVAFVLALAGVLYWPIRALIRRRRKTAVAEQATTGESSSSGGE